MSIIKCVSLGMDFKEELMLVAEKDYCVYCLRDAAKKVFESKSFNRKPIEQMIDKACNYDPTDWRDVAMVIWWAKELNKRLILLDMPTEQNDGLIETTKAWMVKAGQEEFLNKVLEEMDKED